MVELSVSMTPHSVTNRVKDGKRDMEVSRGPRLVHSCRTMVVHAALDQSRGQGRVREDGGKNGRNLRALGRKETESAQLHHTFTIVSSVMYQLSMSATSKCILAMV